MAPVSALRRFSTWSPTSSPKRSTQEKCWPCTDRSRALLEEITAESHHLHLRFVDFAAEPEMAERLGVNQVPATVIAGPREAGLRFDGLPVLASQPAAVFSGEAPLLAEPGGMGSLLDHPSGKGIFAASGRPFAFTGAQPLPAFGRNEAGELRLRRLPAVLALEFPDRPHPQNAVGRQFQLRGQGLHAFQLTAKEPGPVHPAAVRSQHALGGNSDRA